MVHQNNLTVKAIKYKYSNHTGHAYVVNKLKYDWKDFMNFDDLRNHLKHRKFLKNRNCHATEPKYFLHDGNAYELSLQDGKIYHMSICICCYNEEWSEISGTLRSISKNLLIQKNRPDKSFQLHVSVYIIQDGWNHASSTFKEGISQEFDCPPGHWIQSTLLKTGTEMIIVIPDVEIYYPAYETKEEQSGVTFLPIFITKSRNAQKYNSHLHFFSLCYLQNPEFVFMTDCGTIFDSDCLYRLLEYLYKHHKTVIGVTARQRVMDETTRHQVQEYPYWSKRTKHVSCCTRFFQQIFWWLSPAPLQGYEFESTFIINTAMFNIVGALPVLPGPCQLLWWEHFRSMNDNQNILDTYFKHLNMDFGQSGLLKSNTILAEDRILSFSMVLRSSLKTIWVNGATFKYEPMMSWVKLLGQRRRWVNGTISTYVYYLFNERGVNEFVMSGLKNNLVIKFLWSIQLYQSFLQIFSPSFFTIALFESIVQIFKKYPYFQAFLDNIFVSFLPRFISSDIFITGIYILFYLLWIFISISLGKKSNCCNTICYNFFVESIYIFFAFVNFIVSVCVYYVLFTTSGTFMLINNQLIYILACVWGIPFILSILISPSSTFLYLIYTIPFFCNIIQYVSYIPTHALSRFHDLSWGNRDSSNKVAKNCSM